MWRAERVLLGGLKLIGFAVLAVEVWVTDRWTYRCGRRTAVVVSLSSGADLWLTGLSTDRALRQLD